MWRINNFLVDKSALKKSAFCCKGRNEKIVINHGFKNTILVKLNLLTPLHYEY